MNNSLIQLNFSIDPSSWLHISLQTSLFRYTLKAALSLNDWKLQHKVKPWSAFIQIGPLFLKAVDDDKLTDYIYKTLKENENKMYSES